MSALAIETGRAEPWALASARERLRQGIGRRAVGMAIALAVEALLFWALISLGYIEPPRRFVPLAVNSFDVANTKREPLPPAKQPERKSAERASLQAAQPPSQPSPQPSQAAAAPQPAVIIPVSPQQMQSFDLSRLPKAPVAAARAGPMIGPVDTPRSGDSERVGTAPNGAAMYAARWYREPTDQELRGYLSTAQGPAWGLITCKTAPDFRVEDCVGLDQYPENSRMLPAILAAAWQFRVRPPQVGGVSQVGDWVRIRIDYELRPAGNTYAQSR